jgi:hypothetical protein
MCLRVSNKKKIYIKNNFFASIKSQKKGVRSGLGFGSGSAPKMSRIPNTAYDRKKAWPSLKSLNPLSRDRGEPEVATERADLPHLPGHAHHHHDHQGVSPQVVFILSLNFSLMLLCVVTFKRGLHGRVSQLCISLEVFLLKL